MDYDTFDMLNCLKKDKLQLFLQHSYVAITYIKVIILLIYNGNAGWDDDVISTQWTHELQMHIFKSEMSHKQFNSSMNYETDSMLNWKKTSCNNYSLQCII